MTPGHEKRDVYRLSTGCVADPGLDFDPDPDSDFDLDGEEDQPQRSSSSEA